MKTYQILFVLVAFALVNFARAQNGRNLRQRNAANEVVTIKGTITEINHPAATLKGDDGKTYELRLGPIWFWRNNNISLDEKAGVEVTGEVDKSGSKVYVYPYTLKQNGKTIELADKNGAPLWSGGNKGKGAGRGQGMGQGRGQGRGRGCGRCCNW